MSRKKRVYRTKEFKFKVAIEAIKGNKQLSELAEEFKVHPNQISQWKKELLDQGHMVFDKSSNETDKELEKERDFLYRKVGQQAIEIDFFKKNLGISDIRRDEK
jgi:transposase-like protein